MDDAPAPTPVVDEDRVENEIPQNVLLVAVMVDNALEVTNIGNVTMSEITVESSDANCDLGTLAPDASAFCEGVSADWTVSGSGPQGQPALVTASS